MFTTMCCLELLQQRLSAASVRFDSPVWSLRFAPGNLTVFGAGTRLKSDEVFGGAVRPPLDELPPLKGSLLGSLGHVF
jgi:hypothetical protein